MQARDAGRRGESVFGEPRVAAEDLQGLFERALSGGGPARVLPPVGLFVQTRRFLPRGPLELEGTAVVRNPCFELRRIDHARAAAHQRPEAARLQRRGTAVPDAWRSRRAIPRRRPRPTPLRRASGASDPRRPPCRRRVGSRFPPSPDRPATRRGATPPPPTRRRADRPGSRTRQTSVRLRQPEDRGGHEARL